MKYTKPLLKLIEQFQRFPGVGPKSAERMAFHLINQEMSQLEEFSKAIIEAKTQIKKCSICQNLSSNDPCEICTNYERDKTTICLVSESKDLAAIDRADFKGLYHVLGGLISPIDGIGPDNLTIKELIGRLGKDDIKEIIVALDSSTEGEATTLYLHRILSPLCNRITRLGFGLSVGAELEYADELTLSRALESRTLIS
jgi:recombination protein RecR